MNKYFTVGSILVMALALVQATTIIYGSETMFRDANLLEVKKKPSDGAAPVAVTGDDIYIAWPDNKTGNFEVMFRASSDGGARFADKINLSNSPSADSIDAEIATDGGNVIITWWERIQTAEEPVARISSDAGATFGPLLRLATNGSIGQ